MLQRLPNEIILAIGNFLDIPDINRFARTDCRAFGLLDNLLYKRDIFLGHGQSTALSSALYPSPLDNATKLVIVQKAIRAGVDVNLPIAPLYLFRTSRRICISRQPPITLATWAGYIPLVQPLVDAGGDINGKSSIGIAPIVRCIKRNDVQMTKFLLRQPKIDLGVRDHHEVSLLSAAAMAGALEVARLLLPRVDDPNDTRQNNVTPLYAAVAKQDYDMVRLLLSSEAVDPNLAVPDTRYYCRDEPNTPLALAATLGRLDILQLLHDDGRVNVDFSARFNTRWAARYGLLTLTEICFAHMQVQNARYLISCRETRYAQDGAFNCACGYQDRARVMELVNVAKMDGKRMQHWIDTAVMYNFDEAANMVAKKYLADRQTAIDKYK